MRRHILGFIALASLALAAIFSWYRPLESYRVIGTMGLKVALIAGVFWLAWPDLDRLPRWVWWLLPIGLVMLFYARGVLMYLFPVFAAGVIFYMMYRKFRRT